MNVAQFQLSSDINNLSTIIPNFDHHSNILREALYTPLALVAPRLSINDHELIKYGRI